MRIPFFIALFLCACFVYAQTPDPDFGTDGIVYHSFPDANIVFEGADLQADGKIVSVGYNGVAYNELYITRHTPDGDLDITFNGTGYKTFSFGASYMFAQCVSSLPDNRIAVGGSTFGDATIAMFTEAGDFDIFFGGDGVVSFDFGADNGSKIEKIIPLTDGSMLAAGYAYNGTNFDFMVLSVLPDGTLNPAFGTDGKVIIDVDGFNDFVLDAEIQNTNDIILAGYALNNAGVSQYAVVRLLPDGSLDESFAAEGKYILKKGSTFNEIEGVVIDSENRIILAGRQNNDLVVLRLTTDGIIDESFNATGYRTVDFNGNADRAFDLCLQSDGKILAAGWVTTDFGTTDFACARLLENGELDGEFGASGKFTFEMGIGGSWVKQVFMSDIDKILLCGQSSPDFTAETQFSFLQLQTELGTGVASLNHFVDMLVFPNPASEYIETSHLNLNTFQVFSSDGRRILFAQQPNRVDLKDLPSGIYLFEGYSLNGDCYKGQLIVQQSLNSFLLPI